VFIAGIQQVLETEKVEGEEWIFLSSKDGNLLREAMQPHWVRHYPPPFEFNYLIPLERKIFSVG
jgi:hypothetical protein